MKAFRLAVGLDIKCKDCGMQIKRDKYKLCLPCGIHRLSNAMSESIKRKRSKR